MIILSHRGYWLEGSEKNSLTAFTRSFASNWGIETDVRDCKGELVISHDPPSGSEMLLSDLLDLAERYAANSGAPLTIALNVKSDGLAAAILDKLCDRKAISYFVFDMSVPDMRSYLRLDMSVFTRMSEVEVAPAWFDESDGVWLDSFDGTDLPIARMAAILKQGKRVCVVSPELHGRDHLSTWYHLKPFATDRNLMLCTDFPHHAEAFFEKGDPL